MIPATIHSQAFAASQRAIVKCLPQANSRLKGWIIEGHAGVRVNTVKAGDTIIFDGSQSATGILASNLITGATPSILTDLTVLFDEYSDLVIPVADPTSGVDFDLTDTGGGITPVITCFWTPA